MTQPRHVTAHVLDVGRGLPAAGMALRLSRLVDGRRELVTTVETNADGRTDQPLVAGDAMASGVYEVTYSVGDYFARTLADGTTTFFAEVPVQFVIRDEDVKVHVALLVSPWSYTTYRGS
ncbi:MAG: hydroxyisourate hydrolase [Ilumatobacteraceae bacterium]|nr:hydroxyisourate hydrolase [Ilumatobacteraceae bacterium]